jgi:hypothetical protein
VIPFKGNCTTAPKIPKPMHYSYVANFKLMMIKHAEETINCTTKWKLSQNRKYNTGGKKILLLKRANSA